MRDERLVQFPRARGGGDVLKRVPHWHPGEVEACYDRFCLRVTTSEQGAAVIGGGMIGALAGATLSHSVNGVLAGAILGAVLGAVFAPRDRDRPTY